MVVPGACSTLSEQCLSRAVTLYPALENRRDAPHLLSVFMAQWSEPHAESKPADAIEKGLETLLRGRAGAQHG